LRFDDTPGGAFGNARADDDIAILCGIIIHLGPNPRTPPRPAVRLPDRLVTRRLYPRQLARLHHSHQDSRQKHRLRIVHARGRPEGKGK
jgi:hypothetical protein